jgi:hypothetical protein
MPATRSSPSVSLSDAVPPDEVQRRLATLEQPSAATSARDGFDPSLVEHEAKIAGRLH